jgi:hypothetical protein
MSPAYGPSRSMTNHDNHLAETCEKPRNLGSIPLATTGAPRHSMALPVGKRTR